MNTQRNATTGRRQTIDIHFTGARALQDAVEFDGVGETGERYRFEISADTLRALANDAKAEPSLLPLFERRKQLILGVATRAFNAGARGDPIQLHRALFRTL